MFCTSCGAELTENAAFCIKCGEPVVQGGDAPSDAEAIGGQAAAGASGSAVRAKTAKAAKAAQAAAASPVVQPAQTAHAAQVTPQPQQTPPFAQPAAQAQPASQPAAQQLQAQQTGKINPIVIIVGVAAVAVIVIAIVFMVMSGGSGSTSSNSAAATGASSASASAQSASASSSAASASSEAAQASSAAQESAAPAEPAPVSSQTIDLSNPDQYRDINLFLSNFSEIYFARDRSITTSSASSYDLATFALWHTYRNSPDLVETSSSSAFPKIERGSGEYFNLRITQARCDEIVNRYFGRGVDYGQITAANSMQMVCYRDGYVYSITTNGRGLPEGVTLARSATDQADGTIRVEFDVYSSPSGYDASDTSLYACTPQEIMGRFGASAPSRRGVAVVRYGEYDQYTHGLKLVSWQAS